MATSTPLSNSTSTDLDWETVRVQSPPTTPNSPTVSPNPLHGHQPPIAICATRKTKEVSWFKLEILFCYTMVRGQIYHYDPIAIRKQEGANVTIIFTLDRKLSAVENREGLLRLIQVSHPRMRTRKEGLGVLIDGIAMRRPYETSGPGIRVTVSGLIAQLWEMETYDLEPVIPDLFGTGGNEVHVLMKC